MGPQGPPGGFRRRPSFAPRRPSHGSQDRSAGAWRAGPLHFFRAERRDRFDGGHVPAEGGRGPRGSPALQPRCVRRPPSDRGQAIDRRACPRSRSSSRGAGRGRAPVPFARCSYHRDGLFPVRRNGPRVALVTGAPRRAPGVCGEVRSPTRPVLKHGPRSLTRARVIGCVRNPEAQ